MVAVLKTFSLANVGEGWTDDCRFTYKAPSYADMKALRDNGAINQDMTEQQADEVLVKLILDHFVSGKVMDLSEDGNLVLVDLTRETIEQLPAQILGDIFNAMKGGNLDPKGGESVAQNEPQPEPSDSDTTTS